MRKYLNRDWNFTEEYKESLFDIAYDWTKFKKVSIPHTCKETPFNYFDESE